VSVAALRGWHRAFNSGHPGGTVASGSTRRPAQRGCDVLMQLDASACDKSARGRHAGGRYRGASPS
jgi:hypothetical protein